eukprot:scaffold12816_cov65-Cyclotella_meneghiniana.AAC.1
MPSEIPSLQPSGSPSSPPSSSSKPSSGAKDWTTAASSQIKITASDGAASDTFGVSVSVSGSVLAVGAHYDDDKGSNSGSVYVFKMNSLTGAWDQVQKLVASDGHLSTTPYFGNPVSVSGNTLVAGASAADSPGVTANGGDNIGSAYVFEFEEDQSNTWVEVAKLTASDGAPHDWFGSAVATDGNVIIVCSPFDDDKGQESGSAYVFEKDQNNDWVQAAKLTASDGAPNYYFGSSVATDGNVIVVGSASHLTIGFAYIFENDQNNDWVQVAKLTASDGAVGDRFGSSVSIDGDTIVVGAQDDASAYVFEKDQNNDWVQVAKLTASDGAASDNFGKSVAIDGDALVVGARFSQNMGSVYVFGKDQNNDWVEVLKFTAADGAALDQFGWSVAIDGGTIAVGAYHDDTSAGQNVGSAYIF